MSYSLGIQAKGLKSFGSLSSPKEVHHGMSRSLIKSNIFGPITGGRGQGRAIITFAISCAPGYLLSISVTLNKS